MAEQPAKNLGGRPTKYAPEWMIPAARKIYELGGTDNDCAEGLGVNRSSIDLWLNQHSAFSDTKKEKELYDADVERSLRQRAMGYTLPDGTHIPAHPTAQIFWLKNRQRAKWRDRQEVEHSGTIQSTADPQAIADQLVTMANSHPTYRPTLVQWASDLLKRLQEAAP